MITIGVAKVEAQRDLSLGVQRASGGSHSMRPAASIRKRVLRAIQAQQEEHKVTFETSEEAVAFIESFSFRPKARRVRRAL